MNEGDEEDVRGGAKPYPLLILGLGSRITGGWTTGPLRV